MNDHQDRENEIENFLKSLKSKFLNKFNLSIFYSHLLESSTFVLPSESNNYQNTDSRLKTYMQETKKYKNSIKSNLRHLIHKNITSSISNEKNLDSSISN